MRDSAKGSRRRGRTIVEVPDDGWPETPLSGAESLDAFGLELEDEPGPAVAAVQPAVQPAAQEVPRGELHACRDGAPAQLPPRLAIEPEPVRLGGPVAVDDDVRRPRPIVLEDLHEDEPAAVGTVLRAEGKKFQAPRGLAICAGVVAAMAALWVALPVQRDPAVPVTVAAVVAEHDEAEEERESKERARAVKRRVADRRERAAVRKRAQQRSRARAKARAARRDIAPPTPSAPPVVVVRPVPAPAPARVAAPVAAAPRAPRPAASAAATEFLP